MQKIPKGATVSIRRIKQQPSANEMPSPGATSQNFDQTDDLRVAGTKANQIFGTSPKLGKGVITVHPVPGGAESPRPSYLSKQKPSSSDPPDRTSPSPQMPTNLNNRLDSAMTVRDKEDVLTASASQAKIPVDLVQDDDKLYDRNRSEARHTEYAKLLKLADGPLNGNENNAIQIIQMEEEKKFGMTQGMTQIQQPQAIINGNVHGLGGGDDHTIYNAPAMGQSQTTFRRTPLRVRVEDLMMGVVNEAS